MIKKAFTLIELVFVLVIIGILAGVGASMFHADYLLNDTNYIALKIKQAQYEGVGIDHRKFGGGEISDTTGCITLTKDALNDTNKTRYTLHVTLGGNLAGKTICFDHKGTPNEGNFSNPLTTEQNLTLTYGSDGTTIALQPLSGYGIIRY